MTCYAFKDGILAIDRQCTQEGIQLFHTEKWFVLNDRSIVCGSGNLDTVRRIAAMLAEDTDLDGWKIVEEVFKKDDNTLVHRFHSDGRVEGYCSEGYHPIEEGLWVVGGDFRFMNGCMAMGASAVEAVIRACFFLKGTGFPIDVLDVRTSLPVENIFDDTGDQRVEDARPYLPLQPLLREKR